MFAFCLPILMSLFRGKNLLQYIQRSYKHCRHSVVSEVQVSTVTRIMGCGKSGGEALFVRGSAIEVVCGQIYIVCLPSK